MSRGIQKVERSLEKVIGENEQSSGSNLRQVRRCPGEFGVQGSRQFCGQASEPLNIWSHPPRLHSIFIETGVFPFRSPFIFLLRRTKQEHHGSRSSRVRVAHWHCQSSQSATQDRRKERCSLHYYGARICKLLFENNAKSYRSLVSLDWERQPSSIHSSPLQSRTTPTIRDGMQSRLTRLWKLKSPRQNWKRNFSKVRIYIHL